VLRFQLWFLHRLLRRGAAMLLSGVVLVSLVVVAAAWVIKTRPYDPHQHHVPFVDVAADDFPAYDHAVIVLNYHDVSGRANSPYALTPEQLAAHLDALRKAGFHSVRLRDVEALASGKPVTLPPKPILLTFDDGAASHWLDADPVLARYGFTAVEFLITSKVVVPYRPSYHLSTEQARRMAASGRWEFASHSDDLHTLAPVPVSAGGRLWPALINRLLIAGREESREQWRARVRADLARSQAFFRRQFGHPADAFAFPYGAADRPTDDPALPREVNQLLAQAGFRFAFSTEGDDPSGGRLEVPVTPGMNRFRLPRVTVTRDLSPAALLDALRQAAPQPIVSDLTTLHWIGDHAGCAVSHIDGHPPALLLSASGYGRCAAAVRPSEWTDYRVTADVQGASRTATAYLGVRLQRPSGARALAEVLVGSGSVTVRQQVGTRVQRLATQRLHSGELHHLEVTVRGRRLTIRVDDGKPMVAALDPALAQGAVDFGVAARGPRAQTLAFLGPRLTDLRPRRPTPPPANQQPQSPQAQG
jgi:biofilm PGA synthesis lipoprotein PgaB